VGANGALDLNQLSVTEPVTVAVGGDPLEAVTVAVTVTEADHEPMEVLPRAVVPEASDTGTGGMGAVRSGPLPPPPDVPAME
jgi:hypothetical protein